jgi:bifunctional non-homologous end joining protein LigD
MRDIPVTYVIFDLLYLDGHSTLPLTYEQRREVLDALELQGPAWRTPAYHRGDGAALLEASKQQGLEGIVAKPRDGTYRPGHPGWLKVKNRSYWRFGQELERAWGPQYARLRLEQQP